MKLGKLQKKRSLVQGLALVLGNANLPGFVTGQIYQGPLKHLCLPGLNCYSCPGALGACPIGSIQNALADPLWRLPLYVLGFIMLTGSVLGRLVCGWLCPFGWFQDLLYRVPSRKLHPEKNKRRQALLLKGKHVFLFVFVLAIPLIGRWVAGYGVTAFCSYICPSGTLMAGWPLTLTNPGLRSLVGWLFGWKSTLLVSVLLAAVFIYRPFCRYVCPLGACYGYFNRISLYRVTVDPDKCTRCGICTRQCPMSVPVPYDANTAECIRCGECEAVCPFDAIHCGFESRSQNKEPARS